MISQSKAFEVADYDAFIADISKILHKEHIIERYLQRFAYGTDASFYRLVPKVVLLLENSSLVAKVIEIAGVHQVPITFRAAGTSLSGQAITDSVLLLLTSDWQSINVLEQGSKVMLQPGVIGAHANRALAPFDRKIGPDPASINSCKIGGIAANNASGMCCGVKGNSYHTLADIELIFANASRLNTADAKSRAKFVQHNKALIDGLMSLVKKVKSNDSLVEKIKHKYRLKNTTGYGLNALIDFDDAIDIISHLIIGSEGTLAFIDSITYHTIAVQPYKAAGIFIFDNMEVACNLVSVLAKENVDAVEIMDARALRSVEKQLAAIVSITSPLTEESVALLIEFSNDSQASLNVNKDQLLRCIEQANKHIQGQKAFTSNRVEIDTLWSIRKGMFPAVGSVRPIGTTVIIEDIALPLEKLAEGVAQLQQLFKNFGYHEAIIFGHALAGNLHFVFTQTFENKKEISRYHDFMAAVAKLVAIDYQGSLKAEHGTGRNMAPFVEMEWGEDLYEVMKQLKALFDPKGVLNPGVIINNDNEAHVRHLKTMTAADDIIDTCIECGFCESVCPSKDFSITPRQRIALWRQKTLLSQQISNLAMDNGDEKLKSDLQKQLAELTQDFEFYGIDSCAATGLCGQKCPVGIDTGMFIKTLRQQRYEGEKLKLLSANLLATHFSTVAKVAKLGLNAVRAMNYVIGDHRTDNSFKVLNKLSGNSIPLWFSAWPAGEKANNLNQTKRQYAETQSLIKEGDKVVYVPSCANRIFSADVKADDKRNLSEVILSLCTKAKISVIFPEQTESLCCGMPWQSKGMTDIARSKKQQFIEQLLIASEQGKWPVIIDASPCALTLTETDQRSKTLKESLQTLTIFESTEYFAKHVIEKLTITKSEGSFMLHTTCSSEKMNQGKYLKAIANSCSDNIIEPKNISCCGFAGDKGFYLPELNKSALSPLKSQIPKNCQGGLSNSRTCEIGLSEHSGISYQSVLYLLDQCSEA